MTKKVYPGQQTSDWVAPDGTRGRKPTNPLIIVGAVIWGLIVISAIIANNRRSDSRPAATAVATNASATKPSPMVAAQSVSAEPTFVHELPLIEPKSGAPRDRKALSADAAQFRQLWADPEAFRYDPKFHVLGFDPLYSYAEWEGKVRTLNARAGQKVQKETGIAPLELLTIATEYQRSRGMETDRSRRGVERMAGALNPAARKKGEGRVLRDTQGCADFDLLARSNRALDEGKTIESNEMLDQAGCVSIAAGTIVSAPTRRRSFDWIKSPGSQVSLLVRVNGRDLWVAEDEITF